MPQGGQDPDGHFARSELGKSLNPLLEHLHHENHAISAGAEQTVLGGDEALAAVVVADQTNQEVGLFLFGGTDGAVTLVGQSTSGHFDGTAPTLTVQHDSANDLYEIVNNATTETTVEVASLREP